MRPLFAVLQQIRGLYGRYRGKIADVKTSPNDLTVFFKEMTGSDNRSR